MANEPFEVTHSVLLHGFTACVVVKLKEGTNLKRTITIICPVLVLLFFQSLQHRSKPTSSFLSSSTGIHLQTSSGEIWSPVLVIEPSGGANASFPRRQLFTRLKHEFFRHAHRIQVLYSTILYPQCSYVNLMSFCHFNFVFICI